MDRKSSRIIMGIVLAALVAGVVIWLVLQPR